MIVLGIDPGSRCGWAVRSDDGAYASGVWDLKPPRGSSPGVRYLYLRARMEEVLAAYPQLAIVAYEQAHQRGGAATEYALGAVTHIQSWCAERGLEHLKVHSKHAKRIATGKGNASKDAMMDAARERWPDYTFTFDDECDARFIAEAAAVEIGA